MRGLGTSGLRGTCEAIGGVHCDVRVNEWVMNDEGEGERECVCVCVWMRE